MQITQEQSNAIDAFGRNENMRIFAYAGAGKTSTLKLMAAIRPYQRGHYLAFNRSIADEARTKFGRNVECRTLHSMAYKWALGQGYEKEQLHRGLRLAQMPHVLKDYNIGYSLVKSLTFGCLKRFCQSDDQEPSPRHVPQNPALSLHAKTAEDLMHIKNEICSLAQIIWVDQCNPNTETPLGHDGYLKLWALMNPQIPAHFILVDEAQDLNPVVVGLVSRQNAQIITVGDRWQQIYAWRGAINALEHLPGNPYHLTQSFRFGEVIAEAANDVLIAAGETIPLRGNPNISDEILEPCCAMDAILCRTNAGVIAAAMEASGDIPIHIQGGVAELSLLIDDAQRLKTGNQAISYDLAGFKDWLEVEKYCQLDEAEPNITTFVSLVNKFGLERLKNLLASVHNDAVPGCLTVSTVHKSKGLEWETVEISNDFRDITETKKITQEDRRIFYVAMTRGKTLIAVEPSILEEFTKNNGGDCESTKENSHGIRM